MPYSVMLRALLALSAPLAVAASAQGGPLGGPLGEPRGGIAVGHYAIHERLIIRVPRLSPRMSVAPALRQELPAPLHGWKEHRGPDCIDAGELAGALVAPEEAVDLVLRGGQRVRAKLEGECRQLDFYSGFYLRPAGDGSVCARRDMIYIRSGASCGIRTFRILTPKR